MWQILLRGGWMMLPLVICSVVAVTIIIDRFLFFRRIGVPNRSEEVIGLAKKGQVEEALAALSEKASSKGPLAPVMNVLSA
jgi:biopolymer transport protein ExbB